MEEKVEEVEVEKRDNTLFVLEESFHAKLFRVPLF
jgi:hypothetical protein